MTGYTLTYYTQHTKAMINRLFGCGADPPRQKNYSQTGRIRKKKSQTNKTNNKAFPARLLINPTRSTQNVHVYTASLYDTHIFPHVLLITSFFPDFFLGFVCFLTIYQPFIFHFLFFLGGPFHDRIDK